MKGRIEVLRGDSKHEGDVTVTAMGDMSDAGDVSQLFMVGIGVDSERDTWMSKGIRSYHVELPVTEEMLALIRRKENEVLAGRAVTVP